MFAAAVAAADPSVCLIRHLPEMSDDRMVVGRAGKSAASMAKAIDAAQWVRSPGSASTTFARS
ncbi:hypothetical protein [Methylobacterium sp. WL64]|uniref:hypothetical protein n=1 Tax=Methylobacterium sp. WL64 TaxID=2603894 RepID=UPI0034D30C45